VPGAHRGHAGAHGLKLAASLGIVVADYDATLYSGDYQGTIVGASLAFGRFALEVKVPAYRLSENGREVRGLGDVMVHGHATVLHRGRRSAGVMMMIGAPTGSARDGLGMGHTMLMPEVWAAWALPSVSLTGSLGYGHALGGAAAHASHGGGMWPLVDPMNAREVTYAAGAVAPLACGLAAGARLRGAAPIGSGDARLAGGAVIVWRVGQLDTSFALERGLVGDPFGSRGALEAAWTF